MSAKLRKALLTRHSGYGWAMLFEVPNGTGAQKSRTADAVAMSLWPSRGLLLHGFELKANRSDWLKELRTPEKAEAIAPYCDRWWLVTEPGVAELEEIPDTWGWLELQKGGKLRQKKDAPELSAEPMSRSFLAALLRSATPDPNKFVLKDDIKEELRQEFDRGMELGKQRASRDEFMNHQDLKNLREAARKFEAATGVRLSHFNADHVGRVVRQVLEGERVLKKLSWARNSISNALEDIDKVLEE